MNDRDAMPRILLVVRHAKSSWIHPGCRDIDRPLNERGLRDVPLMARRLAARGVGPDVLWHSPAVRTTLTAQGLAQALGVPPERLKVEPDIYAAGCGRLLDVVRGLPDDAWVAMLVGHNPGVTELVNTLADGGIALMPTCGVAELHFDCPSWRRIRPGMGRLAAFDTPKGAS